MSDKKRQKIQEQLKRIDESLANAEEYVARGVNVEGTSWLHFADWRGKSGHPLWMRNFMIPTMMKHRARKERILKAMEDKAKDNHLTRRRRHGPA